MNTCFLFSFNILFSFCDTPISILAKLRMIFEDREAYSIQADSPPPKKCAFVRL